MKPVGLITATAGDDSSWQFDVLTQSVTECQIPAQSDLVLMFLEVGQV